MIKIYNQSPVSWQDLQNKVAKIFQDMDYETFVEKDIALNRGDVNVDVFAQKNNLTTREICIVECKYWTSAIPKSVVHSVRTVLLDSGANYGYIVSVNGFQKGAYKAAYNSNLILFTFEEFQSEFRLRWLDRFVDLIEELGYPLRKYTSPLEVFYEDELNLLSHDKQDEFKRLQSKYMGLSMLSSRRLYKDIFSGKLDLDSVEYYVDKFSHEMLNITDVCLMNYFQLVKDICIDGVNEFDNVFGKKLRKE